MENEQEKLSIEAKHCIDRYLENRIRFWFVAFGITNVIFLLGAFSYIYFVLPGKAMTEIKNVIESGIYQTVQSLNSQIQNLSLQNQSTLVEYGQVKERLKSLNSNFKDVENALQQSTLEVTDKIKSIDDSVTTLKANIREGKLDSITNLITALEGSKETKELFEKLSELKKEMQNANENLSTVGKTATEALSKVQADINTGNKWKWCNCYDADWIGSFDNKGWSMCKDGFFVVGLYRNSPNCSASDVLGCIENAKCCQPCIPPN